jgi:hypothetical protein
MSCAPIRNMLTDARDSRRDPEMNAQRWHTGAQRSRTAQDASRLGVLPLYGRQFIGCGRDFHRTNVRVRQFGLVRISLSRMFDPATSLSDCQRGETGRLLGVARECEGKRSIAGGTQGTPWKPRGLMQ